ncbi:MAG: fatty acid desaturase [Leptospirales bacterium]|nr:fatty acid desaturase [Leptospirales bacterium]
MMIERKVSKLYPSRRTRSNTERAARLGFVLALHIVLGVGIFLKPVATDWLGFAGGAVLLGMVGVNVGLHRYFSHKSFKTSRAFQFVLGILGALVFTDPIAFAGKHRLHHRHVDTALDVHGPQFGWYQSWIGSLADPGYSASEIRAQAPDLIKFPELLFLNRFGVLIALLLFTSLCFFFGLRFASISYLLPVVMSIHAAGIVNTLGHSWGYRNFASRDTSTNSWLAQIFSFGEGWHNNHHAFPTSAQCGFTLTEWDPVYWIIRALEATGLVWGVRAMPDKALVELMGDR